MNRPNLVESNKHIFGTYAVMAMNNVQLVFEHIRKMAGLPENTHETYRPEDLWTHPVMAELLKAKNGEAILAFEGYKSKAGCKNGIESVVKNADSDVVKVEE